MTLSVSCRASEQMIELRAVDAVIGMQAPAVRRQRELESLPGGLSMAQAGKIVIPEITDTGVSGRNILINILQLWGWHAKGELSTWGTG